MQFPSIWGSSRYLSGIDFYSNSSVVREVTFYDFSSLKIVEIYFMAHYMIYLLNVLCVTRAYCGVECPMNIH